MSPSLELLAAGFVFVMVEMTVTYFLGRRLRNFGVVDVVWSIGFSFLAIGYAVLAGTLAVKTMTPARGLTLMVTLWSIRLGVHLWRRVAQHHPVEDVRYAELRREWGPRTDLRMFGFFLVQGLLQWLLALPFWWVISAPLRGLPLANIWNGFHVAGAGLWVVALAGEALADRQLATFRADPGNRGLVCESGLWNYSRHPNYFFEWLVWVAYALFALGTPAGWWAFLAPAVMFHFLRNVTGIPMTEALSVKSRGDLYRRYQQTTNAFFPGPKRAGSNRT